MNRTLVFGLAMCALTPGSTVAQDSEGARRCMETFAAQYLPGSDISYELRDRSSTFVTPLIAQTGTQEVEIVATSRLTGRTLATATCQIRNTGPSPSGSVSIVPPTEVEN